MKLKPLLNPEVYGGKLAKQIVGCYSISVANRWMMG